MAGLVSVILEWLTGNWVFTLLLASIILVLLVAPGGRPKNFPPGMTILPLVGSLYAIPLGPTREFLQDLMKKYGNMASFGMFNFRFVLVSGSANIKEVFGKNSTTGRPDMLPFAGRNYYFTDGRTGNLGIIGSSGELWHEQRRFVLHHLRNLGLGKTSCEPMMVEEITELVDHMTQQRGQPIMMKRLFNRSVLNVLWGMIMGKRYPYDHTKLNILLKTIIQPGDFNVIGPVWYFPSICKVLRHIPILKNELVGLKKVNDFIEEEIRDFMANADIETSDCFIAVFLREMKKKENTDSNYNMDQLKSLVWDLFMAGMETTSSTLTAGFKMMIENPEVARKVQEELDAVVGSDRLPTFSDMESLPYSQATIHEIQRVFNLTRYAIPHFTNVDCTLASYDIPKGTVLLPNLDDLLNSPKLWKTPKGFDPSNFLDSNGKYKRNDSFVPFGSGKRVCAGESLARLELFLFFTCLMQRFNFTMVEDQNLPNANPLFAITPEYTAMASQRE